MLYNPNRGTLSSSNIAKCQVIRASYMWDSSDLYILHPILDPVVCVICAKQAKIDVVHSANKDFFHWINFLFVKGDYQVRTASHSIHSKTEVFLYFYYNNTNFKLHWQKCLTSYQCTHNLVLYPDWSKWGTIRFS